MKTLFFLFFSLITTLGFAQQTINASITHDDLQRDYILYVPASYSAGTDVPLILNFHGYGSNAGQQIFYGDFRSIADTAGFIVVYPEGTLDGTGSTYWNSNWGGTVDDIGFTAALIDSLSEQYSIDQERVYSTGMSNGGFMSYTLACELSERIAAIASVTGTMNVGQEQTCNPEHPMPVMEIHGTLDPTVPYEGSVGFMAPIPEVLNFWSTFNNCDSIPVITDVPNTDITDASTAENQLYLNGDNGVEVEHYKIIGGAHTWPGAPIVIGITNYDIDASVEIWRFFSQFDINGRINAVVGIEDVEKKTTGELSIYPDPATDNISVQWKGTTARTIRIMDISGAEMLRIDANTQRIRNIALNNWSAGMYLVQVWNGNGEKATAKFLITE